MPVMSAACQDCGYPVPLDWERCPHCARPGLFSNVRMAELPEEVAALGTRYQAAVEAAEARGCAGQVHHFEELAADSRAVINRSALEACRLASSDRELQSTFYNLLEAEVRLPAGDKWDRLRRIADEALFGRLKNRIRFAALTLDGVGLLHYGDCSLVLREDMIAHRASVFEDNSALFLSRHKYETPPGSRSVWRDRAKLCIAKLADSLTPSTLENELPRLLLSDGATSGEDSFVEVHIWGSLSIYSLERGIVRDTPASRPYLLGLQELFAKAGLPLEVLR